MGNSANCCSGRGEARTYGFKEQELESLHILFERLVDSQPETKGGNEFNKKALAELFEENPELGVKLFKFMKFNAKKSSTKSAGINFQDFIASLEVLTGEHGDWYLRQYRKLGKHLLLAMIWAENYNLVEEKSFKATTVSYSEALSFVKCILKVFQFEKKLIHEIDDTTAKVVIDGIFEDHEGEIDWWTLLFYIRQNLINIHTSILFYFRNKFLNKTYRMKLPEIAQPSFIISPDMIALFALSNIHVRETSKISLLYSSALNGFSFEKLALSLKHPGGTLIFLRHSTEGEYGHKSEAAIFGGFAWRPWIDDATYSQDDRSYVFSVYPKFQNFFVKPKTLGEEIQPNFTYFNSAAGSGKHLGIGFGGNYEDEFRLWIDADIKERSYVRSDDATYEKGALVPAHVKKLNIDYIEVWGLEPSVWNSEFNISITKNTALVGSTIVRPSANPDRASYSYAPGLNNSQARVVNNPDNSDKTRMTESMIRRTDTKQRTIPGEQKKEVLKNLETDNLYPERNTAAASYFNPNLQNGQQFR